MNWQVVLKRPVTRLFAIFCVIGRYYYELIICTKRKRLKIYQKRNEV